MANCILAWPNYVDALPQYAAVGFSGGAWLADLPLTNLRDPMLVKVARSAGLSAAATTFEIDLGTLRSVRVLAIPKANLSRAGRIRFQAFEEGEPAAVIYDTGWQSWWGIVYPWGSLPWGHPSLWTGILSEEDAQGDPTPFIHVVPDAVHARRWRVDIDDPSNPEGYVELARLVIAPGWQPSLNMAPGVRLGMESDTQAETSLGGSRFFDERKGRRTVAFSLKMLPTDEVMINAHELMRRAGTTRQVFFIFDPEDHEHLHRRAFMGTLKRLPDLEFLMADRASADFEIEETI